jgi:hypothetical protein
MNDDLNKIHNFNLKSIFSKNKINKIQIFSVFQYKHSIIFFFQFFTIKVIFKGQKLKNNLMKSQNLINFSQPEFALF